MLTGSLLTLPARAKAIMERVAVAVLDDAKARLVANARRQWPVLTGRSRRGLTGEVHRGPPAGLRIRDGSGYGPAIVSHGVAPWEQHLVKPALATAKRDIPRQIVRGVLDSLRVR